MPSTDVDRGAAHNPVETLPAVAHPRWVLVATVLASSLAFIDGSAVNVGLPAIGRDLGGGAAGLQWTVDAYLLPLSALLLLGGALGDRHGHRRVLVAGVVLFAVASAACALTPGVGVLVAARAAQGAGAALLMPSSLAILGTTFTGEARGRAVGIWAAAGAATSALGPVLGGWLVDAIGWRAIFTINLPLAAAVVALARWAVPASEARAGQTLDVVGTVLATAGLGLLTWGLVVGAGADARGVAGFSVIVAGGGLLAGFAAWERRRGEHALVPLSLFASREFVGLNLLTLLLYGALGALLVLLPFLLIEAGGETATGAGAALLPLPVILAVLSPGFGGLAGRVGARPLLVAGPLVVAAGFLMALRIGGHPDLITAVFPAVALVAAGMAIAVAPLTTAVLSSAGAGSAGSAAGLNSAVARVGSLVATACLGRPLASRGDALVTAFHTTAVLASVASGAAAACALLLRRRGTGP